MHKLTTVAPSHEEILTWSYFISWVCAACTVISSNYQKKAEGPPHDHLVNHVTDEPTHTRVCHNHCMCFVAVKTHFFWAVLFKVHIIFYSSLFVSIYSVRRRWRQVQYDWTCAEFIMNSHEIKWNCASLSGLEWSPGSLRVWPKCCLSLTTSTERLRRTRRTRSTRRLENKAREYLTFKKCQFVLWAHRLCAACLSLGNYNTNTKLTERLMEFKEQLNQPHLEAAWCCPTGLKD